MTTVLDRPHHIGAETLPGPHHHLGVTGGDGSDRFLAELATDVVNDDECVGLLVYVGSNNNHGGCLHSLGGDGWAGRRTHLSGGGTTLLSSHAGRSFTPGADKTYARQPTGGSHAKSQTSGVKDPTTATSGSITLT